VKRITWSQWPIAVLLAAVTTTVVYLNDILVFLHEPSALSVYNDDINDNAQKIRQDAQLSGDWQFARDGLALSSGRAGEVVYKVTKEADEDVSLILWYYWNDLRQTLIEVSTNGADYHTVLENTHLTGRSLRLTPYATGRQEIWIRLTARIAAAGSPEPWTVLDKIQIVKVKNPVNLPYLPGIFLFVAIPLTVFVWTRRDKREFAVILILAVLIMEAVLSWLWPDWIRAGPSLPLRRGSVVQQVSIPWIWLGYSFCVAAAALKKGGGAPCGGPLLLVLIALALILRWEALMEFQYHPLDPDAVGYRQIADSMKHTYDTSFREPLWIWTIKFWFLLLGSSDLNLRLLSVLLSLLLLAAAHKLFNDYAQKPAAALTAVALLTVHPYLIFMSIRGLRLEFYSLVILLLAYHVTVRREKVPHNRRLAGLCMWGTAAVMQQLNSLIFVPILWGYAFWRHKLRWKKLIFPAAVLTVLLGPHLLYSHREFGDPLWSANVHAKWYRNYEFVDLKRVGCEGCPTLEEYQAQAHSGAPITALDYVFGMHSFSEVSSRVAKGYADLFLRPSQYFWKQVGLQFSILYYAYLLGLAAMLFSRVRELLIFPVATINLLAFLVPLGIDARLVEHTAPFVAYIMAYALWFLSISLRKALKRLPTGSRPPED